MLSGLLHMLEFWRGLSIDPLPFYCYLVKIKPYHLIFPDGKMGLLIKYLILGVLDPKTNNYDHYNLEVERMF